MTQIPDVSEPMVNVPLEENIVVLSPCLLP